MSNVAKTQGQRSNWRPILPVPEEAPQPSFVHTQRGEPKWTFRYADAEGRTLGYVCRFIRSAGGMLDLTRTWCVNEDDPDRACAWRWIQFRKYRPMYGADRLDQDRLNIVLVVSDELAVDEMLTRRTVYGAAAQEEARKRGAGPGASLKEVLKAVEGVSWPFAGFDFVSWPGGLKKIGETDFSPLRGRICAIWLPHSAQRFKVGKSDPQYGDLLPLARQPWRVAALKLKETLVAFGAVPISITEAATTEELPDGWGPLDALNSGWDFERLAKWHEEHFAPAHEVEAARKLASGAPTPPEPAATGGEEWMRTLIREEGVGRLLPELHNVRKILTNDTRWRGVIYLDGFSHSVMKAKPPPFEGGEAGEWRDTDDSMTSDWLAYEMGILKLKTSMVGEAVQTVAKLAAKNPLVEYLKGLKWDRRKRLDTWLREYLKAGPFTPDMSAADIARKEEYLRIVGRKWLLGAAMRALKPGCKFDYVLILEGQQGLGKSTAFAIIGGDWTMDTPFSLGDKEGMETIRGVWIVEMPELDSFNKAESTLAKSFFSRTKDRFRLPYAKRSTTFLRSCVFGATSNEYEYFRDPTGNRRYWSVRCDRKGYDKAALQAARDQLLAEAVAAVQSGEQIWPTAAEELVVQEEQRRREIPDPWVGKIARWLTEPGSAQGALTRERILTECLKVETGRMDERGMATRIGKAMHKLGYEKFEDKTLPERFRYEKRQSVEEGDTV